MKRNIILLVMALVCTVTTTAQEVVLLHLKDGTTLRYPNGRHEMTRIKFYDYMPPVTYYNWSQTQHDNGYYSEWEVSKVWHVDRQFSIGVEWTDNTPQTFQPRYGLCFGTEPGLTVDNCLYKAYCADVEVKYYSSQAQPLASIFPDSHYMLIGPNIGAISEQERNMHLHTGSYDVYVTIVDTLNNCIKTALEPGKTYYYRPFTEVQATEHGKFQTKVTYSRERSFRVPRVMADFGYYPRVRPSEEALNAFYTHFPDHVVVGGEETATQKPAWDDLEPAWDAWRESEEGKQTDISADISSDTFDDGTGYRLIRIPNEFYTWLTHREVVVDAFDGLVEHRVTCRPDSVRDVDAKWGVPGGKYIRINPTNNGTQQDCTYGCREAIPGVRYKLVLNFAPETEYAQDEEHASYFLPVKIRVQLDGQTLVQDQEIPATEVTTLTFDDVSFAKPDFSIKYETRVPSLAIRNKTHNRVMRIAEARLIPQ